MSFDYCNADVPSNVNFYSRKNKSHFHHIHVIFEHYNIAMGTLQFTKDNIDVDESILLVINTELALF